MAVGKVEAIGREVADFAVGDQIAYIARHHGGNAPRRVISAALAVGTDDGAAAPWILKGQTAQALVDDVEPVRRGMSGLVIGTAGSSEKAAIAVAAGCHEEIMSGAKMSRIHPVRTAV